MKIQFVLSPTGAYGLAYHPGEIAELAEDLAKELCEKGYAVPIPVKEKETAIDKSAKNAEKR